jgi:UDP-GlcNAc:undecaprenyl-phosphate GlcNAc-1-phosphate transferase
VNNGQAPAMLITAFMLAALFVLILTPFAIITARKLGIVDQPNSSLKRHTESTPYLGGLSILIAIILTLMINLTLFDTSINAEHAGLLLGLLLIVSLGLFDDMYSIKPLTKLVFQCLATAIVWTQGLDFFIHQNVFVNGFLFFIWMIGISNALNLVDIMDGLASGIGGIAAFFIALLMFSKGELFYGLLLCALAGACLSFLVFNFKPAKIFLGDAGSLAIGFLLASSAAKWSHVSEGNELYAPLLVLGIPIFETIYISLLRLKAGKSPLLGSNDHFAKRMVKMGFSIKQTVIITYGFGVLLGIAALTGTFFRFYMSYAIMAAVVVFVFIGFKLSKVDIHS